MNESIQSISEYRSWQPRPTTLLGWLTVERAVYGLLVAIGVGVRVHHLALPPLLGIEAADSWSAWLAATGLTVPHPPVPTSALAYSLQTALFWLSGANDASARILAATSGSLLILIPWWMRSFLGRLPSLLLALLIALNPWLVSYSRLATGAGLSILLFFGALACLMYLTTVPGDRESKDAVRMDQDLQSLSAAKSRTIRLFAVLLGLLAVSGVMAWSLVPLLGIFVAVYRTKLRQHRHLAEDSWVWFSGAALVGATGWFSNLGGLTAVSTSASVWLAQMGAPLPESIWPEFTVSYPQGWAVLRLIVDQPLVLPAGILGLGMASQGWPQDPDRQWVRVLWYWMAWGAFLIFLPGRSPYTLLPIAVPLLFGSVFALTALVRFRPDSLASADLIIVFSTVAVLLVSGTFWAAALISTPQLDMRLVQALVMIIVLGIAILVAYGLWSGWHEAAWLGAVFATLLFGMASIGSLWQLNHRFGAETISGYFGTVTHPDVRNLVQDVETLSAQRVGDPHELSLVIQMTGDRPDPVLGWYLRAMRRTQWVTAPGVSAATQSQPPLVITPAKLVDREDPVQIPAGHIGSDYHIRTRWLPGELSQARPVESANPDSQTWWGRQVHGFRQAWTDQLQPVLRWALYRKVAAEPPSDKVTLWISVPDR